MQGAVAVDRPRYRVPAGTRPATADAAPPKLRADTAYGLEAGRSSRRMSGFLPGRSHVNTLISQSGQTVLARARYLVRNNGYAANAVEAFAANAVGAGIVPSWRIADPAKREEVHALWKLWTDEADAEGLTDFYGLQRRAARELFIAGEVFLRIRPRRLSDGLTVPLQLQMMPSEMLDATFTIQAENGNQIRQGIEFDFLGRRVAYHFWRVHPGDSTETALTGERVRVPADQVIHIIDPVEAGQVRGLSRFAAAIVKLWSLDAYDDAELERKKTAALLSVFIARADPQGNLFDEAAEAAAAAEGGIGKVTLEPGTVHSLLPGEEPKPVQPADSGQSYEPFQYRTLLQVCVALGIPYYTQTGDLRQANYSSLRSGLLEFQRRVEAFQHGVLVYLMCRRVARVWLDQAVLSGALTLRGYATNPAPWTNIDWIPPTFAWVDPKKDMEANVGAIVAGLTSRTAVIKGTGRDPEEVDREIAEDNRRARELGLTFGVPAKTAAPEPDDDEAPEPAATPMDREDGTAKAIADLAAAVAMQKPPVVNLDARQYHEARAARRVMTIERDDEDRAIVTVESVGDA